MVTFLKKRAEENEGLSRGNIKKNKVKIGKITKKLETRKGIDEEAKIELVQTKVEVKNSEVEENERIENDKIKTAEKNCREDEKEENRIEDNTKEEEEEVVFDENKTDVELKEELPEEKEEEKDFVRTELEQGSERGVQEVVERTKRQHKSRRCHRKRNKLCAKGTRGAEDFGKRKSWVKARLFQDKEDRRKHEEALVSRIYKISYEPCTLRWDQQLHIYYCANVQHNGAVAMLR